jgi:hypothetical protein
MKITTALWDRASYSLVEVDRLSSGREAVRTSETSVYFNDLTRNYIKESCRLYTRCC